MFSLRPKVWLRLKLACPLDTSEGTVGSACQQHGTHLASKSSSAWGRGGGGGGAVLICGQILELRTAGSLYVIVEDCHNVIATGCADGKASRLLVCFPRSVQQPRDLDGMSACATEARIHDVRSGRQLALADMIESMGVALCDMRVYLLL